MCLAKRISEKSSFLSALGRLGLDPEPGSCLSWVCIVASSVVESRFTAIFLRHRVYKHFPGKFHPELLAVLIDFLLLKCRRIQKQKTTILWHAMTLSTWWNSARLTGLQSSSVSSPLQESPLAHVISRYTLRHVLL